MLTTVAIYSSEQNSGRNKIPSYNNQATAAVRAVGDVIIGDGVGEGRYTSVIGEICATVLKSNTATTTNAGQHD